MTITLTNTSAFEQFKPIADSVEAKMIKRVTDAYSKWAELSGGKRVYYRYSNTSEEAEAFRRCISFVRCDDKGRNSYLDQDRLAKKAKEFGEDTVLGFVAKLINKLGNIEMTDLTFYGGGDFTIVGQANGRRIVVEQQTVYKVNKHNNLYCQFPARIYVDGKFTPAAKFKDAIA